MKHTYKGRSDSAQKSLLEQLQEQGIFIPADCGGIGRCGKCRVQFLSGAPEACDDDQEIFDQAQMDAGWRLACRAFPEGEYEIAWEQSEDEMEVATEFAAESDALGGADKSAGSAGVDAGADDGCAVATDPVIAVDIGTTTLAASLVDRATGKVLETPT